MWLIIGILVVLISYYGYLHLVAQRIEDHVNSDTLPHISTLSFSSGDLIFLSGHHPGERICKSMSNSFYSHVGIILVENDIVYILDCDVGQNYKDGVRVMELEKKLERYKGSKIGGIRHIKTPLPNQLLLQQVEKYKNIELDDYMWTWCVSKYPALLKLIKDENKMFCSEFIATILMNINQLSTNETPQSYTPQKFAEMEHKNWDLIVHFKF